MKNNTVVLLIVAGACGLVTMLAVRQYLASHNQKDEVEKVQVLVAAVSVKPGEELNDQNTTMKTVEIGTCPEGCVTDPEQIKERGSKVARDPGDWILAAHLTAKGGFGAVGNIPNGMRLTTVPVDSTTNHSGMLQPGNRIDLFLSYRERDPSTGTQKEKVIPLLEYIEVFAVDSQVYGADASGENDKARNISLLVDTEQLMKITLARKKGTISTALRSSEDVDKIRLTEMTEDSLSGGHPGDLSQVSSRDTRNSEQPAFVLPEDSSQNIMNQLQAELQLTGPSGSGPVAGLDDSDQYWTMAIHEAGAVRVERVNTSSDEPLDTRGGSQTNKPTTGAKAATPKVPGIGDLPPIPGLGGDAGGDEGGSGLETLEEAATGLLDLFN